MMNLDLPDLLREFLKSLFRWDVFPNPFAYAFDGYDLTEDKPFARADDFGITSTAFFLNAGNLFLIAFIIVMLYPVFKLASNPDSWANEVVAVAINAGRKPSYTQRQKPLGVSGVGNGSQACHYDCTLPSD